MLPIAATSTAKDASVLVHELGHTVLGGLANEYVEKPMTLYHGREPKAPNVTAEKPNASGTTPAKWSKWTLNPTKRPSWDTSPIRVRGRRVLWAGPMAAGAAVQDARLEH